MPHRHVQAPLIVAAALATIPLASHADDRMDVAFRHLREQAQAYEHGEGVAKDAFKAYELYCSAAAEGDAESQYRLGWMYANGRGVQRSDELAAVVFNLAATQGHAQARAMLEHLPAPDGDLPECMQSHVAVAQYDDQAVIFPDETIGDGSSWIPANEDERRIVALVRAIAPQYNVDPALALAVIRAESNFDAAARSPKNAQGLMQLIPETAARFNVKKPYDPAQNIRGGVAYLRWLLAYFRGNVPLVAAAYNAGEGAVDRYRGIPPYAETRAYVQRIVSLFRKVRHPFDPTAADPSPELARMSLSSNSH